MVNKMEDIPGFYFNVYKKVLLNKRLYYVNDISHQFVEYDRHKDSINASVCHNSNCILYLNIGFLDQPYSTDRYYINAFQDNYTWNSRINYLIVRCHNITITSCPNNILLSLVYSTSYNDYVVFLLSDLTLWFVDLYGENEVATVNVSLPNIIPMSIKIKNKAIVMSSINERHNISENTIDIVEEDNSKVTIFVL